MTGRTHDVVAFLTLALVIVWLPELPTMSFATAVVAFGANFVGGLFPDIDQPTSDMWDNFRLGPFVAKVICPALGGHRHISHSLVGVVLIGGGSKILLDLLSTIVLVDMNLVWWSFMIGVGSHIVMDLPTKAGVPLLWPVRFKFGIPPFKFLRIESGKWIENFIIFPGSLALTGYVLYLNQDRFIQLIRSFWPA